MKLINSKETEFEEPIEEMGQIALDTHKINRIKSLINPLKMDLQNRELISQRIATMAFQRNINFQSANTLFDKIGLNTDQLNKVYRNYDDEQLLFKISELIPNSKNTIGVSKKQVDLIENTINTMFLTSTMSAYPSSELTNTSDLVLIPSEGKVVRCIYRDEDKTQLQRQEVLLNICPVSICCHIDARDEFKRVYDWKFINQQDKRELNINNADITTTAKKINDAGYSAIDRETKDTLSKCINALANYKTEDYYSERVRIVPRGFAYDKKHGSIMVENYHLINSEESDIISALHLINEYVDDMVTDNEKIFCATNFKWGLYAPFIYASKQMVTGVFDVESPYLQGVGGTGKTTGHGELILAMWYDNITEGLIQGTEIDTFPQFSYAIERDTLPLVFDEGGSNFENEYDMTWLNRLKSALNSINWRHTRDKDGRLFESRNPFMITSNGQIHDPEFAVTRRLFIEQFTLAEIKTPEMEEYFLNKYQVGTDNNRLLALKHISHTFAKFVISTPQVLGNGYKWKEVVDGFLQKLFEKYDIKMNPFLKEWVDVKTESIQSELEREQERFREAIKKQIVDTKRYVMKDENDPHVYLEPVLNNMTGVSYVSRGEWEEIRISKPFITNLYQRKFIGKNYTLKDASLTLEEFGFSEGKSNKSRFIRCAIDRFIEWLYPELINFY